MLKFSDIYYIDGFDIKHISVNDGGPYVFKFDADKNWLECSEKTGGDMWGPFLNLLFKGEYEVDFFDSLDDAEIALDAQISGEIASVKMKAQERVENLKKFYKRRGD